MLQGQAALWCVLKVDVEQMLKFLVVSFIQRYRWREDMYADHILSPIPSTDPLGPYIISVPPPSPHPPPRQQAKKKSPLDLKVKQERRPQLTAV